MRNLVVSALALTAAIASASASAGAAPAFNLAAPERTDGKVFQLATKRMPPRTPADAAPSATDAKPASQATLPSSFEAPKRTLSDCLKLWDKDTHMTKAEWKDACIRSMREAEKHEREVKAEAAKRTKKDQK